jgi:signal transduction histidine kinase
MRKTIASIIKKERNWLLGFIIGSFSILLILVAIVTVSLAFFVPDPSQQWLVILAAIASLIFFYGMLLIIVINRRAGRVIRAMIRFVEQETHDLQAAANRSRALQAMASTLRATLSFERVVEAALDVCGLSLEEAGVPARTMAGVVFLYEKDQLFPVATRSFLPVDHQQQIFGTAGVLGEALKQAVPAITEDPARDPELRNLRTFRHCHTVVCVPLRVGFQIFGAMIIGTKVGVEFTDDQLAFFNSVADHVVIALQNAQLYEELREEKEHLLLADEAARKELARDLHDGPTQSVAAIAMRVNFIRSLIKRDPEQAVNELAKVEELAREASRNIRGMLFTLRPLVLETEGLAAALEHVMERHAELSGLNMRLVGGEYADLLNDQAQGVVFTIMEEALGNARKYSQAEVVEMRFWREGSLFVAQVSDDGVGFDMKSVNASYHSRGSLGMVNMQERAERIEGSIRIESAINEGTTVTLVVPLNKNGQTVTNGQRG